MNPVILGWENAFSKLSLHSRARLRVESDFAYGSRGSPGIPPNSDLVFEVHILKIQRLKKSGMSDAEVARAKGTINMNI